MGFSALFDEGSSLFPVMFRLLDNVDHGLWLTEMSWLVFSHLSILYYCHPRVRASLRPSMLDTLRSRSQKEALQVRHWRLDGAPLNSPHCTHGVYITEAAHASTPSFFPAQRCPGRSLLQRYLLLA